MMYLKKMVICFVMVVATYVLSCSARVDRSLSRQELAELALCIQTFVGNEKQGSVVELQSVLEKKYLDKGKARLFIESLGIDLGVVLLGSSFVLGLLYYFLSKNERCDGHSALPLGQHEVFMGPYSL